jgi:hypothetical protein
MLGVRESRRQSPKANVPRGIGPNQLDSDLYEPRTPAEHGRGPGLTSGPHGVR